MRATFQDAALQAELETKGYVTFPMLEPGDVAALRAKFDELGPAPGDPHMACHSSFHTYDFDYKKRVDAEITSVIAPHLAPVFDRQRALPCNFIMKWPSGMSGFGLHQDLALVDESQFRSVEVWMALEDTNETNGQLWMVPGSHTWKPSIRGIHAFDTFFDNVAKRIIDRHAVPVPVKAGDAVVFTHPILHFSLPNRSDTPRLVAITDLIPEEAQHIHYFGDDDGNVQAYAIDETFWTNNSPFTLWKPPPASQSLGPVEFEVDYLTDDDLDRLVAEGRAVESDDHPRGAPNPGKAWCFRCGTTDFDAPHAPDRLLGNVTMICADCRDAEVAHAPTAAHVGA